MHSPPENSPQNIFRLPTAYLPTAPPRGESYENHRSHHTPIVIDNGSTSIRWGFGTSATPYSSPNAVAKYKERKTNRPLLLFGEAIDSESGARAQAKTPWEGDVLLNFDALVSCLEHGVSYFVDCVVGGVGKCFGLCVHTTGHRHSEG
jgi:actin-related protein 5